MVANHAMVADHECTRTLGPRLACHEIQVAARRLYDAECALHAARQSRVDAWIAAAGRRLHDAVVAYLAATESAANRALAPQPDAA